MHLPSMETLTCFCLPYRPTFLQAGYHNVRELRQLTDGEWNKIVNVPILCRVLLKYLVRQSINDPPAKEKEKEKAAAAAANEAGATSHRRLSISNTGGIPTEQCVICFEEDRNIVVFDCMHLCLGEQCADMLATRDAKGDGHKCPICGETITKMVKIYK